MKMKNILLELILIKKLGLFRQENMICGLLKHYSEI